MNEASPKTSLSAANLPVGRVGGGDLFPGDVRVGRYHLQAQLGRGGMGTVYRAIDLRTQKQIAIKYLGGISADSSDERSRLRFRREFHTLARLRHPNIVSVYDYGLDAGRPYYTMEFLAGQDLQELGRVEASRACSLTRDIAGALVLLHSQHLVHRDLSTRNVRCTSEGRAKLLDFGMLSPAGSLGQVAGTPASTPPEALHHVPIDHRYDLYSLGVLAYFLLTGHQPFPAREWHQLRSLWTSRPQPPSSLLADISPALDALVGSMLSLEPLGRPASAAEVLIRLSALTHEPAQPPETGPFLTQAAVVRRGEMIPLGEHLSEAARGHGSLVVIDGSLGMGKSRLLRDVAIEAQTLGAIVLHANGTLEDEGPFGLLRTLLRNLADLVSPDDRAAANAFAPLASTVAPELGAAVDPAQTIADPITQRLAVHLALCGWIETLARRHFIVLLIDDLHLADEASCAVIAALGRLSTKRTLLIVASRRRDEPARSSFLTKLLQGSRRISLEPLGRDAVKELLCGLFGDMPSLDGLAQWMHARSGGLPLLCIEIARHLVQRGTIRYTDGRWSTREPFSDESLPASMAEAMQLPLEALSAHALLLAQVLSVHRGPVPLEHCGPLLPQLSEEQVFTALDELIDAQVLVASGNAYSIRHDALRSALLQTIDASSRQRLHAVAAEVLARGPSQTSHAVEIGWHLVQAGQLERGGIILLNAGRKLFTTQATNDAVAPLETALEALLSVEAPVATLLEIEQMLTLAGMLTERSTTQRYAPSCTQKYERYSGMAVARRLSPLLGRRLSFVVGLAAAALRRLVTAPKLRGPTPVAALQQLASVVSYRCVLAGMSFDVEAARQLERLISPLATAKGRVPEVFPLLAKNMIAVPIGRSAEAKRNAARIIEILTDDLQTPMEETSRRAMIGGCHSTLALFAAFDLSPRLHSEVAAIRTARLAFCDLSASLSELAHHRLRGEEDRALAIERTLEVQFIQGGAIWIVDSQRWWTSGLVYGALGDVVGLGRCIDKLRELVEVGYHFQHFLGAALGDYQRERGELAMSIETLRGALDGLAPDEQFVRKHLLASLAESCLLAENPQAALPYAQEGLRLMADPEIEVAFFRLRLVRILALVEARLGDVGSARARLEKAIDEATSAQSPAVCGLLHEAAARVCLIAGDGQVAQWHCSQMRQWVWPTKNATLIARFARLESVFSRHPLPPSNAPLPSDPQGHGAAEIPIRALERLVRAARARHGFLYILEASGAVHLLSDAEQTPEPEMDQRARQMLEEALASEQGASRTISSEQGVWLLWTRTTSRLPTLVGAVVLVGGAPPELNLLDELARSIRDTSDGRQDP